MKLQRKLSMAIVMAVAAYQPYTYASITATDILNILVEEGVLSEDKAVALVEKVRERSDREQVSKGQEVAAAGNAIDVPYVPSHIKNGIKRAVKQEVIDELQGSVVTQAKAEGWGINEAPDWVNLIKISGDFRARYQTDIYPSDNPDLVFFDINKVNDAGGVTAAGRDAFLNTVDNRNRLRARARLKVEAEPAVGFKVGFRLVTGNDSEPTSANQTFNTFSGKWDSNFDLAYIQYKNSSDSLKLTGGKISNPFFHTDLVWDSDVTLDGIAATWHPLRKEDFELPAFDPYIKIGAFTLQEILEPVELPGDTFEPLTDGKWLYAFQIGSKFQINRSNLLDVGLAYYHYDNVVGIDNGVNQNTNNVTASPFYQFGNTLQNIIVTDGFGDPENELFALASEFELINLTGRYEYLGFRKHKLGATADYVINNAFDSNEVADRIGVGFDVPERDIGYQIGFDFGTKSFMFFGDWRASFKYRYLEGDAVLDAFADSDFLVGGTNAKGYILKGDMVISNKVFLTMKWLSAEEIDAADVFSPFGDPISSDVEVDTLQLDINAKF